MVDLAAFQPWLQRWALEGDGPAFQTPFTNSLLMPVRHRGCAAILKLARTDQERLGAAIMAWWAGEGAARVLACEGEALLLERAQGPGDLARMATDGDDDEATRIICRATVRLHRPRSSPPKLTTLRELFSALERQAGVDPRVRHAHELALDLLDTQTDVAVLHGDMHHFNVLDFGDRGWLAIDPWGVVGDPAYDYANTPRNPDLAMALKPGRLLRQVALITEETGVDPARLVRWCLAHAGLSAAWQIEDGDDPHPNLAIIDAFSAQMSA